MNSGRNWLARREVLALAGGLAAMGMMIPENPVVGGTVLRRASIQSPNFVTGSSGWAINQDGSAEFNNVVIRNGQIVSGTALYYSGPPGAGKLVASVAAAAGTDVFGNFYLAGIAAYKITAPFSATVVFGTALQFWTATVAGGPWTAQATVSSDASGNLFLFGGPTGKIFIENFMSVLFGASVTGGLTVDSFGTVLPSGDTTGATDTPLLQAALNAKRCILPPASTYWVNATLELPQGCVWIGGGGVDHALGAATAGATVIRQAAGANLNAIAATTGWDTNANTTMQEGHWIRGLRFEGQPAQGSGAGHGLVFQTERTRLVDCAVWNTLGDSVRFDYFGVNGRAHV